MREEVMNNLKYDAKLSLKNHFEILLFLLQLFINGRRYFIYIIIYNLFKIN